MLSVFCLQITYNELFRQVLTQYLMVRRCTKNDAKDSGGSQMLGDLAMYTLDN